MPSLELERELFASGAVIVAGIDEVGRGALAGPVAVGVAVISPSCSEPPAGLDDSKVLSANRREALIEPIQKWVTAYAVGMAQASEIDELGIVAAQRLAWIRAYRQLDTPPLHVILDGKHNWVGAAQGLLEPDMAPTVNVTMKIKADRYCASVAAASVLAKVERDALMRELAQQHPEYGWQGNVGYGAAGHLDALRKHGATQHHRRSWNLPIG